MDRDNILKKLLTSMADRSNERAQRRGATPVGQRRLLSYSNPRFMGGDPVYEDVYRLEQVLRSLAENQKEKKPKRKKPKVTKKINAGINFNMSGGGGSWRDDKGCFGSNCRKGVVKATSILN